MTEKTKNIIKYSLISFIVISIAFAITKETKKAHVDAISSATYKSKSTNLKNKITAYYFHGNARCQSCMKIEKYSYEAIEKKYATEIQNGTLEWLVLNVEEPANEHFIQDYQLHTKSLIISLVKDGKQKDWKNLEKVWENLNNPEAFYKYVQSELDIYFTELKK